MLGYSQIKDVFMGDLNKSKYKNAILYLLKYCNNEHLGKTKLNKLLYYLDFISYRDRGKSITGDVYIHEDYGPIPTKSDEILSELKKEKKIKVDFDDEYKKYGRYNFSSLKSPNLEAFDKYEKELLEKICKLFYTWSNDKIITQTHLEAPWFYSKPYDVVDYGYAKDIDFFMPKSF